MKLTARKGILGWALAAVAAFLIVAALVTWATFALFSGPRMMYIYGYPGPGYFPFFFPFGFLILLLVILLVFRLIFWRSWGWGYWRRRGYYGLDSKEILKRRYARGEITKEQFEQMLRDIDQHP